MSWRIQNNSPFLKAYYPLNNHARDLVGGNDGTWTNEAYTEGPYGRSVGDFDGSSNIDCSLTAALAALTSNFTVSMSIKLEDISTDKSIITVGNGNNTGWHLRYRQSDNAMRFTTMAVKDYLSGVSPVVNNWFHFTITMDSSYDVSFYSDGVFDSTVTHNAPASTPTSAVEIGAINSVLFMNGQLGDVRIYNIALTAQECHDLWMQERNS